jgi:hypothetical protein
LLLGVNQGCLMLENSLLFCLEQCISLPEAGVVLQEFLPFQVEQRVLCRCFLERLGLLVGGGLRRHSFCLLACLLDRLLCRLMHEVVVVRL